SPWVETQGYFRMPLWGKKISPIRTTESSPVFQGRAPVKRAASNLAPGGLDMEHRPRRRKSAASCCGWGERKKWGKTQGPRSHEAGNRRQALREERTHRPGDMQDYADFVTRPLRLLRTGKVLVSQDRCFSPVYYGTS
ncbi:hypothetical protein ACFL2Q_18380, partial [Thermodesulfobacteriota bacterium]